MKIVLTGASGMVGRAVLIECLADEDVDKVLAINRSTLGIQHPKYQELLVSDFSELPEHAFRLEGYDACFHCMGVSAVGLDEATYSKITFGHTKTLMDTLFGAGPDMTVTYVSGAGTDSSEKGSTMWARVKGKTENYVLGRGFKDAYVFRPGLILPQKGVKSKTGWYNAVYLVLRPFYPLLAKLKGTTGSSDVGKAMLALCRRSDRIKVVEAPDINRLAESRA